MSQLVQLEGKNTAQTAHCAMPSIIRILARDLILQMICFQQWQLSRGHYRVKMDKQEVQGGENTLDNHENQPQIGKNHNIEKHRQLQLGSNNCISGDGNVCPKTSTSHRPKLLPSFQSLFHFSKLFPPVAKVL